MAEVSDDDDSGIYAEGGGKAGGDGNAIQAEGGGDDEGDNNENQEEINGGGGGGGGDQFPGFYEIISDIQQEMEVRFMDLDYEGNLYTISGTDRVQMWNRGQMVQAFWSALKPVNAFVVKRSAQYTHAFFAHDKGKTKMWVCYNLATQPNFRRIASLQAGRDSIGDLLSCMRNPGENTISCLCLSDDGNFIYAGSTNHVVYVYWIHDFGYRSSESIHGHSGEVLSLAVGRGVVFSGSSDGGVRIWKRERHGFSRDQVRHRLIGMFLIVDRIPMRVNALAFHSTNENSGRLYAGSSDRKVRCWKDLRIDERQAVRPEPEVMSFHTGEVTCLALSSGPFVFSGSKDGNICVWRKGAGDGNHTIETVLTGHNNPINCIATQLDDWTENGAGAPTRWILHSSSLNALRIWRVHEEPLALQQ